MKQESQLLYLSRADVIDIGLDMKEIISAVEDVFREKAEGRTQMPPKPGIHPVSDNNFIHAMPAYIHAMKSAGVKWVSGYPENFQKGLPYINGLLILNDPETGMPVSVMDCVWITAMRTGAATAVAAKYLARPDSSSVGILGCGVQGRTNIEALNLIFPLQKVTAYDINLQTAHNYADEIRKRLNLEVVAVKNPKEAVTGSDIVVTAGPILKTPHATIQAGWLDEGAFASLVDFDSYWHGDALKESSKFCTDDIPQLRHYQGIGFFQNIPQIHAELGELVTGRKSGRENTSERTMTANLGLALEDMAVAPLIYKKAVEKQIGTWLKL
jgi:ornithine cyclodeaminase/alanine dehydrogenase-like protein (mu-crystallin family)